MGFAEGKKKPEKRRLATFPQERLAMADWLREGG
jgi:hypothetical protein